MILLDWYREWREIRHCQSCEILEKQLELANYEKQQLLNRITLTTPPNPVESKPIEVSVPRMIPWKVKQQILEREDREKARALRHAAISDTEIEKKSTEELEKEMDLAAAQRGEKQTS